VEAATTHELTVEAEGAAAPASSHPHRTGRRSVVAGGLEVFELFECLSCAAGDCREWIVMGHCSEGHPPIRDSANAGCLGSDPRERAARACWRIEAPGPTFFGVGFRLRFCSSGFDSGLPRRP
jgi:hypothetical protein